MVAIDGMTDIAALLATRTVPARAGIMNGWERDGLAGSSGSMRPWPRYRRALES
jgi:hypothetical protein